jgi:hypothetical protein
MRVMPRAAGSTARTNLLNALTIRHFPNPG